MSDKYVNRNVTWITVNLFVKDSFIPFLGSFTINQNVNSSLSNFASYVFVHNTFAFCWSNISSEAVLNLDTFRSFAAKIKAWCVRMLRQTVSHKVSAKCDVLLTNWLLITDQEMFVSKRDFNRFIKCTDTCFIFQAKPIGKWEYAAKRL